MSLKYIFFSQPSTCHRNKQRVFRKTILPIFPILYPVTKLFHGAFVIKRCLSVAHLVFWSIEMKTLGHAHHRTPEWQSHHCPSFLSHSDRLKEIDFLKLLLTHEEDSSSCPCFRKETYRILPDDLERSSGIGTQMKWSIQKTKRRTSPRSL